MSQRIKGQDVEIQLIVNGTPKTNITAVRSFEVTMELDQISEGYLGETTERKDSIFKGVSGKVEFHLESQAMLEVFTKIVDNAKKRTTPVLINIKATLNFPNGDRPKILISNVEFGSLPLNFSSRSDYATTSLDFTAPDLKINP